MTAPDFDLIARPYALLEKLTLGTALTRCRFRFLDHLQLASKALVIGDGDGRFVATLLARNQHITILSVDSSAEMLRLQSERVGYNPRLTVQQADARAFTPPDSDYDLIVTHFFLDCLTQPELDTLVQQVSTHIAPGARWAVSDFVMPAKGFARVIARVLIPALYLAFRVLTGLRVSRLPDSASSLRAAGFRCIEADTLLSGILRSELWIFDGRDPAVIV